MAARLWLEGGAFNCAGILLYLLLIPLSRALPSPGLPMVINTWGGPFTAATDAAYLALLKEGTSALDAVETGCATCERNQCDSTVGFGGSPDEACETTLDALLMDGITMKSGAVAGLRRVRDAVSVARFVLERTSHSLLVGDHATRFAVESGFREEHEIADDGAGLSTPASRAQCDAWKRANCQPNYRINVVPDPASSCGPYTPSPVDASSSLANLATTLSPASSHDTISMVAIHASGPMAAGTSTNGASHKIPGRVGDGPIVGSGSYVDGDVGGCGATGDGDIMMRFLPCYQAVENLRRGMPPQGAAEDAVRRMVRKYPNIASGIVVVDRHGEHGAAGSGWTFTYAFRGGSMNATEVITVPPVPSQVLSPPGRLVSSCT
ncbi:nucleophile aminohydrolase [Lasiosphaeria ovina]|uniref:Nucleophile aminohydrolase n=1 Tax=Lasiosphaeria ovina TaxID=92902 RepID=A0AAE0KGZ2_9PEZI|nr:nucleophile aminohydrolase [Lasiosphaeria ovina]